MIFPSTATFAPKTQWVPTRPDAAPLPFRIITTIAKSCLNFLQMSYEMCCSIARFFKNPYPIKVPAKQAVVLPYANVPPLSPSSSPSTTPNLSPRTNSSTTITSPQNLEPKEEPLKSPQQLTNPSPIKSKDPEVKEKSPTPNIEKEESPKQHLSEPKPAEIVQRQEISTAWKVAGCIALFLAGAFTYSLLSGNKCVLEEEALSLKQQMAHLSDRLATFQSTCFSYQRIYDQGVIDTLAEGSANCMNALAQYEEKHRTQHA